MGQIKTKIKAKKKFWEFKALANNEGELSIYGEIANSQGWWGDGSEVTPKGFKEELDALGDISTLNVYVNSPGGDVFAGQAIYSQLKRHKATVNMYVDGLAASIASVIAMAGDTIHMPSNAMMMIHKPMSGVWGNATEMRKAADDLDKIELSIQETYLSKATDMKQEDLVALLDAETWLTAQECFDLGLCDVIDEAKAISASIRDFEILDKYKNAPKSIKAQTGMNEDCSCGSCNHSDNCQSSGSKSCVCANCAMVDSCSKPGADGCKCCDCSMAKNNCCQTGANSCLCSACNNLDCKKGHAAADRQMAMNKRKIQIELML